MFADLIEKYKSFFVSTIEIIPDWIERARLDAPHKGFVQVKLQSIEWRCQYLHPSDDKGDAIESIDNYMASIVQQIKQRAQALSGFRCCKNICSEEFPKLVFRPVINSSLYEIKLQRVVYLFSWRVADSNQAWKQGMIEEKQYRQARAALKQERTAKRAREESEEDSLCKRSALQE